MGAIPLSKWDFPDIVGCDRLQRREAGRNAPNLEYNKRFKAIASTCLL